MKKTTGSFTLGLSRLTRRVRAGGLNRAGRRLWTLGLAALMAIATCAALPANALGSASNAANTPTASNTTAASSTTASASTAASAYVPAAPAQAPAAATTAASAEDLLPSDSNYQSTGQAALGLQDGKVVVYEFFSFTCPHCRDVYDDVHAWAQKNPHVKLVYVPVNWGEQYEPFMRLYYTLEALDHLDWMGDAFATVQDDHHFDTPSLIDWLVSRGVDRDLAVNTFNAFSIGVRLRQATELGKRYSISGTPTFIINGSYLVTPQLFSDMGERAAYQATLNTTDALVNYVWASQQKK